VYLRRSDGGTHVPKDASDAYMTKQTNGPKWRKWLSTYRSVIVAAGTFAVALVIATTVLTAWGSRFFPAVERATAWLTGVGLRVLQLQPRVAGSEVQAGGFSLLVVSECTGVFPTLIFVIGVLAAPFRWRYRIWGVLLGLPALVLLNWIRMVSLTVVGIYFPAQFDTIHLVVWQPLYVFLAALLWGLWAWQAYRRDHA